MVVVLLVRSEARSSQRMVGPNRNSDDEGSVVTAAFFAIASVNSGLVEKKDADRLSSKVRYTNMGMPLRYCNNVVNVIVYIPADDTKLLKKERDPSLHALT